MGQPHGMPEPEPLTYTIPQAAQAVGVSPWLIKKMVAEGVIPLLPHTGRRKLISRKRLIEWVDQRGAA